MVNNYRLGFDVTSGEIIMDGLALENPSDSKSRSSQMTNDEALDVVRSKCGVDEKLIDYSGQPEEYILKPYFEQLGFCYVKLKHSKEGWMKKIKRLQESDKAKKLEWRIGFHGTVFNVINPIIKVSLAQ